MTTKAERSDEDLQDEQSFNKHLDRIKDLINGSKTSLRELIKCRKELESMRKDLESMQTEIDWNLKVAAEINEALKKVKQEMRFVNAEFVGVRCEAEETLKFFQDVEKSFHDFQHCLDSLFAKEETKRLEEDLKVKLQQKLDEELNATENKVSKKTKKAKRKINRETDQINEKIEKIKTKKLGKDDEVEHEMKKLERSTSEEMSAENEYLKRAKKRKYDRKEKQPNFATKIDHHDEAASELENMKDWTSSVGGWRRS